MAPGSALSAALQLHQVQGLPPHHMRCKLGVLGLLACILNARLMLLTQRPILSQRDKCDR